MVRKIFIINGGQKFAHSGGRLNKTIVEWDKEFLVSLKKYEIQTTDVNELYDVSIEVEKFLWADVIIYHFPIWWFSLPHKLKAYIDTVFTEGHRKGMYYSDGRKNENPDRNYGTGGLMQGRSYMVVTTWNAPKAAFTIPREFFKQKSEDDGVLFGFHRMNAFISLEQLPGIHFHDVEKNMTIERLNNLKKEYLEHLQKVFG